MKLFILLFAVVFAIYHFSEGGSSSAVAEDVPLLVDPSEMNAEQKAALKVQLEHSLKEIDAFIANPPVIT